MIDGVQDVYCNVRDMKKAVSFYKDVLGLKVGSCSKTWTAMC